MLEHEFFCLAVWAAQASKEKKVDFSFSEQLLRVAFQMGKKEVLKTL